MSTCNKEMMDYDLIKKCCRCKSICLKSNFYKIVNKEKGINSICKVCMKNYIKDYMKNRRKTDVNFRLICNTRRRIHHALNGKSKSSSTLDILGLVIETYKKRIEFQMTPNMTWDNIEIDHVKAICMFNVTKDEELKEVFNWKKHSAVIESRSSTERC